MIEKTDEMFKKYNNLIIKMVNIKHAEEVYQKIKDQLKGQEGKILALDVESGDYFIGKDTIEAYNEGRKKYPHKEFFFKRIGAKAAFMVG